MKKNKVLALVLSLALVLGAALPGTVATSSAADSATTQIPVGQTENAAQSLPEVEDKTQHIEGCVKGCEAADCQCSCHSTDQTPSGTNTTTGTPAQTTTGTPTPSDTPAGEPSGSEPSGSESPVDGNPSAPVEQTKVCTCGDEVARDEADNVITHAEGCDFYVPPTAPTAPTENTDDTQVPENQPQAEHMEGCAEGCTTEDCGCACHQKSLFERLMACETLDALFALVEETAEEELLALTDEENAAIEAKIAALEPEPLPPVVLEDCENESVVSEIIYPAVNFANVAPFGAPVEG